MFSFHRPILRINQILSASARYCPQCCLWSTSYAIHFYGLDQLPLAVNGSNNVTCNTRKAFKSRSTVRVEDFFHDTFQFKANTGHIFKTGKQAYLNQVNVHLTNRFTSELRKRFLFVCPTACQSEMLIPPSNRAAAQRVQRASRALRTPGAVLGCRSWFGSKVFLIFFFQHKKSTVNFFDLKNTVHSNYCMNNSELVLHINHHQDSRSNSCFSSCLLFLLDLLWRLPVLFRFFL